MKEKKIMTHDGNWIFHTIEQVPKIDGMHSPVECVRCGHVFDLADVKTVHRYADCTTFEMPCCKFIADNRVSKSIPDIKRLD